jgi:RHS repeat-associated protein
MWVDNFLGFNVGEKVPVGYYDREKGVWVPSDNGLVVQLLDTNGDGIVDALDANGDGQPDDLNGNGSFADEVAGLNNPQRYPPGSTFWRFAVPHLTPWDCNWPYGPPADATAPNPKGVPVADQQKQEESDCRRYSSSFVEERSRIFHEDIPIPGTDLTLHYTSSRVKGYQHEFTVPASGETLPASLKRIIVQLNIAGRSFEQTLSPLPNQKVEFVWDGLDFLGKTVRGPAKAELNVGFVYNAVYYSAGSFAQSFAKTGSQFTNIQARQEVISWKRSDIEILAKTKSAIAEGWTLSNHHYVSPMDSSTLYKGDGTIVTTIKNKTIDTVAGSGTPGSEGDGGPATQAQLTFPNGVATDASGNLYIADSGNDRVRKVDTNGIISTVAGTGASGFSGDGGPATQAKLDYPAAVAVDGLGNLYIADSGNCRIRKVDTSGVITTVAGNEVEGYGGDDGPAIQAKLRYPYGVAVDVSGNLYIADYLNNRIRKVDTNGVITTVAGDGTYAYGGDGGPATQAKIAYPRSVAVDVSGNLYIADSSNYRIRKVDTSGVITTVAGTGTYGYSGDGGEATKARISYSYGIEVDVSGNIYFSDYLNNRIRKVDTDGIIITVAGKGSNGSSGDGGPPTQAELAYPVGVAVGASGNLFIGDYANHRIRKVTPFSIPSVIATNGEIAFAEKSGQGYLLTNAGRHRKTIDLDTGISLYEFGYDQNNNLVSITDRFGNKTVINRDNSAIPTSIISPDGITTTLTIDTNNYLKRITYPDGYFYSFEYTPVGLMSAKIEPKGNRFEHFHDSIGRLTEVTDQEGGHWQFSRQVDVKGDVLTQILTGEGNLTSYLDHTESTGAYTSHITDPSGAETLYSSSGDGLTSTKSLPCGMTLSFKYGVDSQYRFNFVKEMKETTQSNLERITLREKTYQDTNLDKAPDLITEKVTLNDKTTTLVTDTLQSKRTMTSPLGRETNTFYDPNKLLTTKLTIPGLFDTDFGYDVRGRLASISTNTRQTNFGYDSQGNLYSITDPEGHATTYNYDSVGRMTRTNRPDGTSVGFVYDNNGNMTLLINPSSIDHGFGYNKVNLNSSYQTPLSGNYSYLYNRDRRLLQINFPSGKQIKNIYDKDRIIKIQTPEGNIDLTYLCGSKLGSLNKAGETISFGYDGSLVTPETLSGTLNQTLTYAYNNDFNLSRFTYAGGSIDYTYDTDGLLVGSGNFAITRNAGNGLPEAVSGGPLNLTRAFNGYGQLESENFAVNSNSVNSWNLIRDKAGRIISKTEAVGGVMSNYAYTYDSMGRLLTVTKDGLLVEEYQYDLNGRRTYEINVSKGIYGKAYTYSDEDHLLTAGDVTYQYDLDGFLTTKMQGAEATRYSYSSKGELLRVDLPGDRATEYINDPLGRRIAKKVDGIITEKYLWQGITRLLAVYDGNDNLVMRFEYGDARMPVAMTRNGATYNLAYDQVGSLKVVTDVIGNVIKRVDYDSFGNIISDTNSGFEVAFGFAGGFHDRDTGLVRFGFRDYDPDIGRWTAKDPILFAGGDADLYGYVGNNPVNFIDPEGKISVIEGVILGAYSVAAVVVFKDCMERCTQTRLPRDPNACEPPRNWVKCAELCSRYALLLGFGADPLGSASSTIGQEISKRIGK